MEFTEEKVYKESHKYVKKVFNVLRFTVLQETSHSFYTVVIQIPSNNYGMPLCHKKPTPPSDN